MVLDKDFNIVMKHVSSGTSPFHVNGLFSPYHSKSDSWEQDITEYTVGNWWPPKVSHNKLYLVLELLQIVSICVGLAYVPNLNIIGMMPKILKRL